MFTYIHTESIMLDAFIETSFLVLESPK